MLASSDHEAYAEAPRSDTVRVRSESDAVFQVADSISDPTELDMRVETVFTESRVRVSGVMDTGRGEGRIITRLITSEASPTTPSVTAAPPVEKDVSRPAFDSVPRWDDEDRPPDAEHEPSVTPGQDTTEVTVLATVERFENATKPEFPGGIDGLQRYLRDNTRQPRGTRKAGMVTIGFTVNKKGEVVNVQVLRSLGRAYDAEAVRVVSAMPDWEPSRMGEHGVKSKVQVRVRFTGTTRKMDRE